MRFLRVSINQARVTALPPRLPPETLCRNSRRGVAMYTSKITNLKARTSTGDKVGFIAEKEKYVDPAKGTGRGRAASARAAAACARAR